MAEQTFETFIEKERERLTKARQEAHTKRKEIDEKINGIDREMAAISAYEAAKKGKPLTSTTRAPRASTGKRGQFGARDAVLHEVNKHPSGISATDVRKALGLDNVGDEAQQKRASQFVANALSYYKREGQLTLNNGLYSTTPPSQ